MTVKVEIFRYLFFLCKPLRKLTKLCRPPVFLPLSFCSISEDKTEVIKLHANHLWGLTNTLCKNWFFHFLYRVSVQRPSLLTLKKLRGSQSTSTSWMTKYSHDNFRLCNSFELLVEKRYLFCNSLYIRPSTVSKEKPVPYNLYTQFPSSITWYKTSLMQF